MSEEATVSVSGWLAYHAALTKCAELLPNVAEGTLLVDVPKYLAEHLAGKLPCGTVTADLRFHEVAMDYRGANPIHAQEAYERLCAYVDGLVAKPSIATQKAITDEQISVAGRALADRSAANCNINKDDNWKTYGHEFIDDARCALIALGFQLPAIRCSACDGLGEVQGYASYPAINPPIKPCIECAGSGESTYQV